MAVLLTADTPSDPFYAQQWHLRNTGQSGGVANQDINVEPIWSEFKGSPNEVIAIVDDGLELAHEDLAPNVVAGLSHNYVTGSSDPTPSSGTDSHGTSVGGIAAARGFNGIGVSGVAPYAGLVGFNFLKYVNDVNEVDALSRSNQIVDIYSNSWGPTDRGYSLVGIGALTEAALASGVANGRGGRGSVYVWAAGNGYDNDNSNYDGYANSRYAIAVSASTNTGARASYSEPGANILVNAPSNGGTLGIMTTDLMGPAGCNPGTGGAGCGPNPVTNENYTAFFGGTSAAAPAVSGVIALMLQANPNLGWRDVRAILATTADKNSPTDDGSTSDSGWTTNGAGYHISHTLGFGRVNATAAVQAARTWTNLDPEESAVGFAAPGVPIPDSPGSGQFGAPVASTITIADDLRVEFVEVVFSSRNHTYWGDLEIVLQSPAGTESRLAETHASDAGPYDDWRFGSARHLGESSRGQWSLTVRDGGPRDTGTFDAWTLRIYGVRTNTQMPLTLSVTGSGGVTSNPVAINCGLTCTALFPAGSTVALTPAPGSGSVFGGWGGDPDCFDGQVTLVHATSCTAVFTPVIPAPTPRIVDTNGDGRGDILLYTPSSDAWTMALSDGGGGFQFVAGSWDPGWTVTPAHLNADARTDFFLYNPTTGQWSQALSTESGTFTYT
ncbi:MAG: S8 family serine peptidase, partial [Acidobacteria bacterium]|nr:S8 family serine peptidase [Acidobacteriota bacterium]